MFPTRSLRTSLACPGIPVKGILVSFAKANPENPVSVHKPALQVLDCHPGQHEEEAEYHPNTHRPATEEKYPWSCRYWKWPRSPSWLREWGDRGWSLSWHMKIRLSVTGSRSCSVMSAILNCNFGCQSSCCRRPMGFKSILSEVNCKVSQMPTEGYDLRLFQLARTWTSWSFSCYNTASLTFYRMGPPAIPLRWWGLGLLRGLTCCWSSGQQTILTWIP